jgi:hypothetical protein
MAFLPIFEVDLELAVECPARVADACLFEASCRIGEVA